MRRLWKWLLFGLWLTFPTLGYPAELRSGSVSTPSFSCSTVQATDVFWANPTSGTIYIRHVTIWLGATWQPIDTGALVSRKSDGLLLAFVAFDRYQPPSALHQWTETFSPDSIPLVAGDSLDLRAWCYGASGINGQMWLGVWYTTTGP